MPRQIKICVTTMDAELQFTVTSNSLGKQLFDQILKTIGLREYWYFGLMYIDVKKNFCWLDLDKKISNIKVDDKDFMEFRFLVRFYPEDVQDELIQDITIKLFYLQVREAILKSEIFCPPETALLLSSYACQVKFGDYDPIIHTTGFLSHERIIPIKICQQYHWSVIQWEEKIVEWYAEHRGMLMEEAMIEYLKYAQDLDMYGVSYFEIKNKKGSKLYLGVDALGLNIYKHEDKLTPQVGFPWNEIKNISFREKRFTIKSVDKKAPNFVFYTENLRVNKNVLALCADNHNLFVRRRRPDSIDIQQMKIQAFEERKVKKSEKDRLYKTKKARDEAESKVTKLESLIKKQSQQTMATHETLTQCQMSIAVLREQLEKESKEKIELERQQQLLLEDNRFLEEKHREESETYKRLLEEHCKLLNSMGDTSQVLLQNSSSRCNSDIDVVCASETNSPSVDYSTHCKLSRKSVVKGVPSYEQDLDIIDGNDSSINKRQTVIESDISLQSRLKSLEEELNTARNDNSFDELDSIHKKNKSLGLDKFKTLRQIRQGNTKKRVDEYELM